MINELEIHNFKSIKDLTLPCKRFNLFIGEPNTGKSNILEALGLVSFLGARQYDSDAQLSGFVRHERLSNLFYDENVEAGIWVRWDGLEFYTEHHAGILQGICGEACHEASTREPDRIADWTSFDDTVTEFAYYMAGAERLKGFGDFPSQIRFYRRPETRKFRPVTASHLLPPSGCNLVSILASNRELGDIVSLPFISNGLRLLLRPHENRIDVAKDLDNMVVTAFPYSTVSETLQMSTFYSAALETCKEAIIVLEEPEAHSFPEDTRLLGEQIALEENGNQYFIVTHNPYFLMPLFSKAPKEDIAINIVYSEDYQTKVRPLTPEELPELFELDIFLNMERYLES